MRDMTFAASSGAHSRSRSATPDARAQHADGPRTLLAQLVHERGLSYEAATHELGEFARKAGLKGTVSARHLQRIARRERVNTAGQVKAHPSTRVLLAEFFERPFEELVEPVVGGSSRSLLEEEPWVEYPAELDGAVTALGQLTVADLGESTESMPQELWTPDLAPRVITAYLFDGPQAPGLGRGGSSGLGTADGEAAATRIRDFAKMLMELDFRHGGGAARRPLLHFFQDEVVPCLNTQHPEAVRREVFSAAAEVAQLLGWTAYDAGRHAAATRYFVQGLRLAYEADDGPLGGRILANLSHQANFLGRAADAVRFARAAQQSAPGMSHAVRAMFLAMEARGLATGGDKRACARVLNNAEHVLSRSSAGSEPTWISYFDTEELAGEAAHCFRDLGQYVLATEYVGLAIHPTRTPPRTKAFIEMVSASAALGVGDLDQAVALAGGAMKVSGGLQSRRSLAYLASFRESLLASHPDDPLAVDYLARADEQLAIGAGSVGAPG